MVGHDIRFHSEIRKLSLNCPQYPLLPGALDGHLTFCPATKKQAHTIRYILHDSNQIQSTLFITALITTAKFLIISF